MTSATELDYVRSIIEKTTTLKPHQMDALALTFAVTHITDAFTTLPRVLALGEKSTGKSDVVILAELLSRNGKLGPAKLMTEPSIRSAFKLADGDTVTVCADEISKLFGADGGKGENHPLYSLFLTGYKRRTAVSSRERQGQPDNVSTFGVVFASGIGKGAGDELRSRSIIISTEKLAAEDPRLDNIEDLSDTAVEAKIIAARKALHSWCRGIVKKAETNARQVSEIHPKLRGRDLEIWRPLFAVAMAAGNEWLERCALAFERMALGNSEVEITPADQVLLDYADYSDSNSTEFVRSSDFWIYIKCLGRTIYADYDTSQGFGKGLAIPALGPTDQWMTDGERIRGWRGTEHTLLMRRANRLRKEIEAANKIQIGRPDSIDPDGDF